MNFTKLTVLSVILVMILGCPSNASDLYKVIPTKEVYTKLIKRNEKDLIHCGAILTKEGLTQFKSDYGISFDSSTIDFNKKRLVFGITDDITTRAFQLLKTNIYYLDYRESGVMYKLGKLEKGKKWSYLQIFSIDIKHRFMWLNVKNIIRGKKSEIY